MENTITDFILGLESDIDSMLSSIKKNKDLIDCAEKIRNGYVDALRWDMVQRYDKCIANLKQETAIIENLIRQRQMELENGYSFTHQKIAA